MENNKLNDDIIFVVDDIRMGFIQFKQLISVIANSVYNQLSKKNEHLISSKYKNKKQFIQDVKDLVIKLTLEEGKVYSDDKSMDFITLTEQQLMDRAIIMSQTIINDLEHIDNIKMIQNKLEGNYSGIDKLNKKYPDPEYNNSIKHYTPLNNKYLQAVSKTTDNTINNHKSMDIWDEHTPYFDIAPCECECKKENDTTKCKCKCQETKDTNDKYYQVLKEAAEIYEKKNHDYSIHGKSAFDSSWDMMGEKALWLRLNDKFQRFTSLVFNKKDDAKVQDEKIEDTLMDMLNYIALGLKRMK